MTAEQLGVLTSVRRNAREPPQTHPLGPHVAELFLVGIAYFTFAGLGLQLASINPSVTPIWPPDGFGHRSHFVVGRTSCTCHLYCCLSDQSDHRRLDFHLIGHCRRQHS